MADDERPVEDLPTAIAALRKDFDDFRTTTAARANRKPTGDVEPTIRPTAKADTLLLQGQRVSRATYPVLWQWVQDNGLVTAGLFGAGDASGTNFDLPDLRGRVLYGADATNPLGAKFGAATVTLAVANLPAHSHPITGSINSVGDHDHGSSGTSTAGSHRGHNYSGVIPGGPGPLPYGTEPDGDHRHTLEWEGGHSHTHNLSAGNAGSGTPVGVQPPSYAVNWLIWT